MYEILQDKTLDNTMGLKITSTLTKQDYQAFIPIIEDRIKTYGKINMLIQFEDFDGLRMGAIWEDFKFSVNHLNDFNRVAVVGEKDWMAWMSKIAELFSSAEIKYFEPDQVQEAWQWVDKTS